MARASGRALRLPAGVRVDGRGVGGRFAGPDTVIGVGYATDDAGRARLLDAAAAMVDRAAAEVARLSRKWLDDPKHYNAALENAYALLDAWQTASDELAALLAGEEPEGAPPVEPPVEPPSEPPREPPGGGGEPPEDEAVEWEVGFDYEAQGGGTSSNFDLTLRIARRDGRPMGQREAEQALSQFRGTLMETGVPVEPAGYVFRGINWRRARDQGWRPHGRSGTLDDLAAFAAPLYTSADDDGQWVLRLGAVE